jgi:molybdopterin-containing oxidoreductase family iron-sulfur binding subunit
MTADGNNGNGKRGPHLAALRARLAARGGRGYWQCLEELADTPEYQEFLNHEFPRDPAKEAGVPRRDVLKYMAAGAALAGLSACTKLPEEKIVPYVMPPEQVIPGKPLFYATAMPQPHGGGAAIGLLVESHMGRPTKIEGNPQHPGSLGGTDAITQASVLSLYDPDRSPVVIREGRVSNWSAFLKFLGSILEERKRIRGAGMRLLTESVVSPAMGGQMRELLAMYPEAKWHQWEPAGRDAARQGAQLAFGRDVNTVYHVDRADLVLSLDADFLRQGPGAVRYAREFISRRKLAGAESKMNRLYVVESTPSNTGAMADHRLPLRASEVEGFARAVAAALGVLPGTAAPSKAVPLNWLQAVVQELQSHRGTSLVVAGEYQPAAVHALAHAINAALGNAGHTVEYTDALELEPVNQAESLRALAAEMSAGKVDFLIISGSNPVYSAPADFDFKKHLMNVRVRVHMGPYHDETAEQCNWHIPEAHYLESWGDARAYDGTVTFIQPLIAPIYEGKTPLELLAALQGKAGQSAHDLVRSYWKSQHGAKDDRAFGAYWETSLHDGVAAGTALTAKPAPIVANLAARLPAISPTSSGGGALEVAFRPDPAVFDGRYANNGWLQELPKPFSTLTWDNAAMFSPATAERLGISNGDVLRLTLAGRVASAPAWVLPGQPDDQVTLHLGYGRRRSGRLGTGQGFDAYALRDSAGLFTVPGLKVEQTGETFPMAATQHHNIVSRAGQREEEESVAANDPGRGIVRSATLEEFRKNPAFAKDEEEEKTKGLTLYPGFAYNGYSWGLAVDMQSCVGCGACVLACQAENNIPVVGKHEVLAGREMHWIRVDTYYRGDLENPEAYYQPVMCMHCENAPCEGVCPVGATVHSPEGLNEMVYNRCVGTRYCSNNCPYKVRRFNFLLFSDWTTPSLFGVRNPNVTVRSRGVMEKCTYCVQRIQNAKIEAEKQDRKVRDGEIVTACQQVCPTEAIVFGNINDPASRVSRLKAQERNYGLLEDLNTRPRTSYLARVRNPNPEMKG